MIFADKGIYHAFVYNSGVVFGYNLNLEQIDPNTPIQHKLEIDIIEKNLIGLEIIGITSTTSIGQPILPHIFILR